MQTPVRAVTVNRVTWDTKHLRVLSWEKSELPSPRLFHRRSPHTLFTDSGHSPQSKVSSSGLGGGMSRGPPGQCPSLSSGHCGMGDTPADLTRTQANVGVLPSNKGPSASCTPNLATPTQNMLCSQLERHLGGPCGDTGFCCVCARCLMPPNCEGMVWGRGGDTTTTHRG